MHERNRSTDRPRSRKEKIVMQMRLVLLYQNNLGTGIFRRLAPRIRYGGSAVSPAFMQRARVARPAAVVGKALLRKRFCGFGVHAAKAAQTLRELRPQRVDRQDKNAALYTGAHKTVILKITIMAFVRRGW